MIELYDFNKFSIDEKADFTWQNATFIQSIKNGLKGYSLFHSKNFFIELEYDKKVDSIVSIKAFKRGEKLEKYIDSVDLDKLFKDVLS